VPEALVFQVDHCWTVSLAPVQLQTASAMRLINRP
jgi:hypothetical protein